MKVSLKWLQTYFDQPLPDAELIAEVFTFHAFEVEEATGDLMDLNVLPNRAADCLCHRGIARELSAILDIPLKRDPLRVLIENKGLVNSYLKVGIEDSKKCLRYMGALIKGVKVGPSPTWLREALEAVGQRSINNIVDATNYVMLNIGQPLHAFDAAKFTQKDGGYVIGVRNAKEDEKIITLTGEAYNLSQSILLITDANAGSPVGIAGIKGGKAAEITESTTDIIVESANFEGTTVRRAAQALRLSTDASLRFQNRPSPELCAYGMREVLALIQEVAGPVKGEASHGAGAEVVAVVDEYPTRSEQNREVSVSLQKINGLLGSDFSQEEVAGVFKRLGLDIKVEGATFVVTPSFERTDLTIPENLVEEVGRILGYDRVPASDIGSPTSDVGLPMSYIPDQARYKGIEKVKDFLVERGFTEISTQSFAKKGDVYLANPLDKAKPALRKSLKENMQEALERAKYLAPLVLAPNEKPKLFEIGTIFTIDGEQLAVETSEPVPDLPEIKDDQDYTPKHCELGAYQPFSIYPFTTRDIAFWMAGEEEPGEPERIIREQSNSLLIRIDQFDRFEKEGRISLAFRLVFQSSDRTLTDDEVNGIMEKVTAALTEKGYEVR